MLFCIALLCLVLMFVFGKQKQTHSVIRKSVNIGVDTSDLHSTTTIVPSFKYKEFTFGIMFGLFFGLVLKI